MVYWVCRFLCWVIYKVFFRHKVTGTENLPGQGGYILAPNHVSYLDPPAAGIAVGRQVYFVAKEELFSVPVLRFLLPRFGCIPIKRGKPDRRALRQAVHLLKEGNCICIFPEGRRVHPGEVKEGEPGAALLAKLAGVPIVPAAILGTRPLCRKIFGVFPWFSRIEVRIGEVLGKELWNTRNDRGEDVKALTDLLMSRIRNLFFENQ